jgi:hypothetical protein
MPPHLTFFVELSSDRLTSLFHDGRVADFLARGGFAVSMGLIDLTPDRAAIIRTLEQQRTLVTAWLLLDPADGYWLNTDNSDAARRRYHATRDWAQRENLRLHRIGLDIEFPRSDGDLLMREGARGLRTLLRRRRTRDDVTRAESAYRTLVDEIHRDGRSVESYHFPHLIDERRARSSLLRRTLGLVDVPVDTEVHMLYATYLGTAGARAYFDDAPAIALGVTGGGVNSQQDSQSGRLLTWERLESDLLAAAGRSEIYVFSLEGCVERQMLERLLAIDWAGPAVASPAPALLRRAQRRRRMLRLTLRAEPLIDLLYPSRRGSTRT